MIGVGPIGVLKGTPTRELDPELGLADPDEHFNEKHDANLIDVTNMETCYCKTRNLRFAPFHFEVKWEMLNFYKSCRHDES